ncbi:MAG: DOMON domain-containing protein, partial [Anaerolineae bacterium]
PTQTAFRVNTGSTSTAEKPASPTKASKDINNSTAAGWSADGLVTAGEYTHQGTAGPLTVSWFNDSSYLYIALQARTTGWLSIGFDPDRTHLGANIIIGAVANGSLTLLDSYGTLERGTYHTPDTELGGMNNIVAAAGSYADGVTTIEFQIPLDSGDQYDCTFQAGSNVSVILATGSTSSLTSMHSFAAFGTLALD